MFPYEFEHDGERHVRELPYDPRNYGWRLVRQIPCCLHFYRDGHLLRVKTDTQMIMINPAELDEDDMVEEMKRLIHKIIVPPKTRESFEKKMGEWL